MPIEGTADVYQLGYRDVRRPRRLCGHPHLSTHFPSPPHSPGIRFDFTSLAAAKSDVIFVNFMKIYGQNR